MSVLLWLEETFRFVLESESNFVYPAYLTLHTFGLAFLVGPSLAIDLRILGVGRGIPLAPLERLYPVMMLGFWMNVVTGSLLFAPEAVRWAFNADFILKMVCVLLGVILVRLIRTSVFHGEPPHESGGFSPKARLLAATSIFVWLAAVFTGRMTAYVDGWTQFMSLLEVK